MEHISDLLRLLGDDNRLRILHLLELEPLTVAELQEVLNLSQSSVSSHLGKLKRAGFLHDLAEGSAHRYRLREDLQDNLRAAWRAVHGLSVEQPHVSDDRQRLHILRSARKGSWVERVAGHLHREYAPGRTWEAMGHAFLSIADLGDCVDVGAGDGAMAELLAASCRSLVCIDPSPAMVAAGEARMRQAGLSQVRYQQAAGEALPVADGACDSVLFMQSLQYIPDPQAAIGEALRVLRPGGRLLCLTLLQHRFPEAERYGHRHQGFSPTQLNAWVNDSRHPVRDLRCFPLAAESRPPRFTPLLLTVRKDS